MTGRAIGRAGRAMLATTMLATALVAVPAAAAEPLQPANEAKPSIARQPNILVWMIDDIGFGQLACFGGLIATPNIDRVARMGVRFSNYHTTPICSSSRAAFLTGRNAHTVHMGGHNAFVRDLPGYDAHIPPSAGTLAENLRQAGYQTFALGKWDHMPMEDMTVAGPFDYWATRQGFDKFYGFVASETDNFHPALWRGTTPVETPARTDYHLNDDLADEAIRMIGARDAAAHRQPFFLYWATGTAHAPHHAPAVWLDRYKGRFDQGWDAMRAEVLRRQIADGVVPKSTRLPPRPDGMPAWDSLSKDEQRLQARQMEAFAAALSHADEQFGRILDNLERRGELDDTIIAILSDNGASAEGGVHGSFSELFFANGPQPNVAQNLPYLDRWGGPETYPHYGVGWSVVGDTPFRYYKQTTFEGGIRVPLIISSPADRKSAGAWRDRFVHVSDLTPTLLDLAGVKPAAKVNNVDQSAFDGRSAADALSAGGRGSPRDQYFEMYGHKALWSDGWKIVSPSRLDVWDISGAGRLDTPWQLYHLDHDVNEMKDVAAANPAKLADLAARFDREATRYNVHPIGDFIATARHTARMAQADFAARQGRWSYSGPITRITKRQAPPFGAGAFTTKADVDLPTAGTTGPLFALGGRFGGVGLYLADGRPSFIVRSLFGEPTIVAASEALPPGSHSIELRAGAQRSDTARSIAISVNGRELVSREIRAPIPAVIPEYFEIGSDGETAIAPDYGNGATFPGTIRSMDFQF